MSRYIGNYVRVPSSEPQQSNAPGVWSISEQLNYQRANVWPPARDLYYNQTVLHLSGDVAGTRETNPVTQPRTFLSDASTNNFLLTPNGDVSARPFSPYASSYSNYFDGIDDALTVAGNAALDLTGDFTIEFWSNMQGNTNYLCNGTQSGSGCWRLILTASTGTAQFDMAIGSWAGLTLTSAAGLFTKNVWTHFAITRSASTFRLFINGVPVAIATNSGSLVNTGRATQIGYYTESSGTYYSQWYLSNLRIIKGTAVYTTGFTPSTTPLTAITNTSLLTCQSNRLIDNSSNNFTITPSSTPAVTQNSPFVEYDTTSGSGYFDGSGDYLTAPASNIVDFAAGQAFTFECWVYVSSIATSQAITASGANTLSLAISGGQILYGKSGVIDLLVGTMAPANQWVHVAVGRNSSNTSRLWVNGTSVATSGSDTYSYNVATMYIGSNSSPASYLNGYISNLRVIKGTDVYGVNNTNITVPTAPLQAVSGTSLLTLQTRAPANNQGILDTSPNNFVVTRTGNVAQGSFSPFSATGWSVYTAGSGSAASRIDVSNTSGIFGTNVSYTIEAWVNILTYSGGDHQNVIAGGQNSYPNRWVFDLGVSASGIAPRLATESNGVVFVGSTTAYTLNTWVHVAAVNDNANNTFTFYINGVSVGTRAKVSLATYSTLNLLCNASAVTSAQPLYISNLRIVNGLAVYTGNFTPPTSPLEITQSASTNISAITANQTALLTFKNNRFIDSSPSARALTIYGTNQIQPFSPFAPTQAYVASQLGGSAYFDASGDSIAITSSIVNPSGTEDFTLEFWFYHTMSSWPGGFLYYLNGTGSGTFGIYYNNVQNEIVVQQSGVTQIINTAVSNTPLNQWNHYVLVRSSNSWAVWINGTRTNGPITNSTSFNAATGFSISPTNAYVSGFRIVKQPLYLTSQPTIPVPTAPPQAVNNTTTLLNFTGAGIVDASGKHTIETVGNVHKSTVQAKFVGTGADYYDGTSDYLTIRDNPLLELGSANFTIEAWIYPLNNVSRSIFGHGPDGQNWWAFYLDGTGKLEFAIVSGNSTILDRISSTTVNTNTWTHVAVSRSGSTFRLFIDGQEPASYTGSPATTSSAAPDFSTDFWIGGQRWSGSGNSFQGYIQDLRVTRGIARYTSNFTPPTRTLELG